MTSISNHLISLCLYSVGSSGNFCTLGSASPPRRPCATPRRPTRSERMPVQGAPICDAHPQTLTFSPSPSVRKILCSICCIFGVFFGPPAPLRADVIYGSPLIQMPFFVKFKATSLVIQSFCHNDFQPHGTEPERCLYRHPTLRVSQFHYFLRYFDTEEDTF